MIDQAQGHNPPDRRDLPSELGKHRERVAEVEENHTIEGEQLSWSTTKISDGLVNLNVLPIQGIPLLPRPVKDVMVAFGLVLERLREEVPVHEPDA
jgi:hypothetical protein